ncbi:hypothetical protein [Bradyrhizobium cytisi]|nr:hypothetical protein [Bradyrhizobium cytisi]
MRVTECCAAFGAPLVSRAGDLGLSVEKFIARSEQSLIGNDAVLNT